MLLKNGDLSYAKWKVQGPQLDLFVEQPFFFSLYLSFFWYDTESVITYLFVYSVYTKWLFLILNKSQNRIVS